MNHTKNREPVSKNYVFKRYDKEQMIKAHVNMSVWYIELSN